MKSQGNELPMGFGMALAENSKALECFSSLTNIEKQAVIDKTHTIGSKQEMQQYVDSLLK